MHCFENQVLLVWVWILAWLGGFVKLHATHFLHIVSIGDASWGVKSELPIFVTQHTSMELKVEYPSFKFYDWFQLVWDSFVQVCSNPFRPAGFKPVLWGFFEKTALALFSRCLLPRAGAVNQEGIFVTTRSKSKLHFQLKLQSRKERKKENEERLFPLSLDFLPKLIKTFVPAST